MRHSSGYVLSIRDGEYVKFETQCQRFDPTVFTEVDSVMEATIFNDMDTAIRVKNCLNTFNRACSVISLPYPVDNDFVNASLDNDIILPNGTKLSQFNIGDRFVWPVNVWQVTDKEYIGAKLTIVAQPLNDVEVTVRRYGEMIKLRPSITLSTD